MIQKYDKSGMSKIYDQWPEISKDSYESSIELVNFDDIDEIIFSGMGGSGILGDVFSSILSKTKIHVSVVKGYHLPNTADSQTLVVSTSISGNTAETLSILDSAQKIGCKLIAFSDGGKMEEYCSKNRIEYRKIPHIHSPRASFTKFFYSMIKVLEPILKVQKDDVYKSIHDLEVLSKKISSSNLNENTPALSLAEWITGKPLIYYPWGLEAAARRFKNSLQENSKSHAMIEDVIEACHNGIVAWEKKSDMQPIFLRGKDDHLKTKERWEVLKLFFKENNIDYYEIFSVEGSIISKINCLIYLLDFVSIYLGILSKIDPTPIRPIDFVKSKL